MEMVDVDGSCQLSADSQPKLIGLVWGLAATRRSVYIHQMNWVNSRNDWSCWQHHKNCRGIVIIIIIIIIILASVAYDIIITREIVFYCIVLT